MSLGTFQLGQKPTLTFTYRDVDGVLTNPSTPKVQVRTPDGTETTYTTGFTSVSTGVRTWTFPDVLDQEGHWHVRALDDGSVGFGEEDTFFVEDSAFSVLP